MINIRRPFGCMMVKVIFILSLSSGVAHATFGDTTPQGNNGGYVETARQAAQTATNTFNASDAVAAGSATGKGVNMDSSTAIAQFQSQFNAANQLVGDLGKALQGCMDAADAEIAAAQAELAAAQAAAAACASESSDEEGGGGDSSCGDAAAAAAAAAQAKIDAAEANKKSCTSHISPMIDQGTKAAKAVSDAAAKAGFTLQASNSATGGSKVVRNDNAVPSNAQVYVPPVKAINTNSLDFWTTGGSGYPGSSAGIDNLINNLPVTNSTPAVRVAASYGEIITESEGLVGDWRTDSKGVTTYTGLDGRIVQFDDNGLIWDNAQ